MDEFDAHIESKISILKALTRKAETFPLVALGALVEDIIHHEDSAAVKNHPRPLIRKGRLIECYLCSQNHL